jgi:hypothetical protein
MLSIALYQAQAPPHAAKHPRVDQISPKLRESDGYLAHPRYDDGPQAEEQQIGKQAEARISWPLRQFQRFEESAERSKFL